MNELAELKKAHQKAGAAQQAWWAACEAWSDAFRLRATRETLDKLAAAMDSTQQAYMDAASRLQTVTGWYLEGHA